VRIVVVYSGNNTAALRKGRICRALRKAAFSAVQTASGVRGHGIRLAIVHVDEAPACADAPAPIPRWDLSNENEDAGTGNGCSTGFGRLRDPRPDAVRDRLVAIVWKIRTPGYEFGWDSIRPRSGRLPDGSPATNLGEWEQQILPHPYAYDTYSVTDRNSERTTLYYDITVYPSFGTAGAPISSTCVCRSTARWCSRGSKAARSS
jgi:hypothetical protein